MEFKKIEISNLHGLLEATRRLTPPDNWLFRGVHDMSHTLLPSVGRVRHSSIRRKITPVEERKFLWRFRDRVRPYVQLRIDNNLEWMILGQHHGLPTRLLDWTRSPIVAAYFAAKTIEARVHINGGKATKTPIDGAIYAVRKPPKIAPAERSDPFKLDRIKLVDPPHVSERVPRQVGVFTIHPTPNKPWHPEGAIQYTIASHLKMGLKRELDRLGVNEASLFPGVDATAQYLGWQLKWGIK